jgi:hypothetical protein
LAALLVSGRQPHIGIVESVLPEDFEMTSMKDREEGFERKFAHDEELKFRATARRNKKLGLWVAEKLGRTGEAAAAYATEVVQADFEEAGDEDVFRKVRGDLDAAGLAVTDQEIRREMEVLLQAAVLEIQQG